MNPALWPDGTPFGGDSLVLTGDLDELVSRVTGLMSEHSLTRATATPFAARVHGVRAAADLPVLHLDYGLDARLVAEPVDDYVALCVPVRSRATVEHNGARFDIATGGWGCLRTPDTEFRMDWNLDLVLLVLRVELEPLRRLAARLITDDDTPVDALSFEPAVRTPDTVAAIIGQVQLLHRLTTVDGPGRLNAQVTARLREQILLSLLVGQPNSLSHRLLRASPPASRSAVDEAARVMVERAGEPLTIAEVARAVGLSVRTLHAGFRRHRDQSPKQFLQHVRLAGARADLLRAAPGTGVRVIDVATRWGFSHPGRFAQAYADSYGEHPSTTLSRRN